MLRLNSRQARKNASQEFQAMLENYTDEKTESAKLEALIHDWTAATTDAEGILMRTWSTYQEAWRDTIIYYEYPYTSDARKTVQRILEETDEEAGKFESDKIYKTLAALLYQEFLNRCEANRINPFKGFR